MKVTCFPEFSEPFQPIMEPEWGLLECPVYSQYIKISGGLAFGTVI